MGITKGLKEVRKRLEDVLAEHPKISSTAAGCAARIIPGQHLVITHLTTRHTSLMLVENIIDIGVPFLAASLTNYIAKTIKFQRLQKPCS